MEELQKEQQKKEEKEQSSSSYNPFGIFDKIYKYVNKTESKDEREEQER